MKKKNKALKIYLAGHTGMVGSSILKILRLKKYKNIHTKSHKQLDLTDQKKTNKYISELKPDIVILAAAKVGGIYANSSQKANFIHDNLMIQTNVIHSSYKAGVKKLLFLGSSCVYPKYSKQPIKEEYLLSSSLEQTNDAYAIAKIAGIKMCSAYNQQYGVNYISLMPTNLYGPGDNYNAKTSHFFPALIKKIFTSIKEKKKEITLWGNGKPKRELMFVDDLALACEFFMRKKCKHDLINIGSGYEKTIEDYCKYLIKEFNSNFKIKFDYSKPNGTPRKLLNTNIANSYGWKSRYSIKEGLKITLKDFIRNKRYLD